MDILLIGRYALGAVAAAAILAGCALREDAQPQIGAPGAMPLANSNDCPAVRGGTGILPDGDFSHAVNPGNNFVDSKAGQIFAPNWEVATRTISFVGSDYWSLDGLCSVDLDGNTAGGIESGPIATKRGTKYLLTLLLSGNGKSNPVVKTVQISIGNESKTYTWDTSGGNDVQNGDYRLKTLGFEAIGKDSSLKMTSLDPKDSAAGAVIGGMSIKRQ